MRFKPYLIAILISFSFATTAESAPTATIDTMLARARQAMAHVEATNKEGAAYYGSAVAVHTTPTETYFLTAGHVITPAGEIKIAYAGVLYPIQSSGTIADSDAGWLKTVAIPGIVPLSVNLDASGDAVNSVAFGYWGRAGSQRKLTGTFGMINRKVIDGTYNDQEKRILRGMIDGSHLVYYGYSGGVVVNYDMQILGINSILSSQYSLAADIRFIWNHVPWKTGPAITYPVEDNFNEIGDGTIQRLRIAPTDKFTRTVGTTTTNATVADISTALRQETENGAGNYSLNLVTGFRTATIVLGGKTYRVVGVSLDGRHMLSVSMMTGTPKQYVIIMDNGFQAIIFLSE